MKPFATLQYSREKLIRGARWFNLSESNCTAVSFTPISVVKSFRSVKYLDIPFKDGVILNRFEKERLVQEYVVASSEECGEPHSSVVALLVPLPCLSQGFIGLLAEVCNAFGAFLYSLHI